MELTFQTAQAQDADVLFAWNKDLIDRYETLESIDYDRVLAWVRRKLDGRIGEYTRVLADGKTAGYFRFVPGEDGMYELDDLYIFPEFQCRGIGTKIIETCCEQVECPVYLYVFVRNERAAALYRRLGFRVTQTVGESRCIMRRGGENY